jgi:hypothetical protein
VGDAVLDAIENKSRWVLVPRWARGLLFLRQVVQLINEQQATRHMAEFEQIAEEDLAEIGIERAGEFVGPGGRAAARERA